MSKELEASPLPFAPASRWTMQTMTRSAALSRFAPHGASTAEKIGRPPSDGRTRCVLLGPRGLQVYDVSDAGVVEVS